MSELYRLFGSQWQNLDFSDDALIEMFNSESYGTEVDKNKNGFYIGKQLWGAVVKFMVAQAH